MEDQCSPFGWEFFIQEEGLEELRQALLYTTLELEATIASAKEEITKRELEVIHLKDVLSRTMKERDEAQSKCKALQLEINLVLQQQRLMISHKQEPPKAAPTTLCTATCPGSDDETTTSVTLVNKSLLLPKLAAAAAALESAAAQKPLPPKGKLLQAVMDAGPLLQNLLLAGPLPRWEHPPPHVDTAEIPPVMSCSPRSSTNCSGSFSTNSNKRTLECSSDASDQSPRAKHQKLMSH